jgi:hypothetical protein
MGSDYCAWYSGILRFVLSPSSGILKNTTFRNLDLFPSSGEEKEWPSALSSSERSNPKTMYDLFQYNYSSRCQRQITGALVSVMSGTDAAIWSKLAWGLLATINLDVVSFRAYAGLPLFFKCTLKVVFCEDVQHRLRFCFDHLSCVKMAAFRFYLQSRKQRSRRGLSQASRVDERQHLYSFWSKIPWRKRK